MTICQKLLFMEEYLLLLHEQLKRFYKEPKPLPNGWDCGKRHFLLVIEGDSLVGITNFNEQFEVYANSIRLLKNNKERWLK